MKKIYVAPQLTFFGSGAKIILGYQGQNNEGDNAACRNCAGYAATV